VLECTHERALAFVSLDTLAGHAWKSGSTAPPGTLG